MRVAVDKYGIRRLSLEQDLPDSGLVLVTGPNSCGKTSLFCDSPLVALFGKVSDSNRGDPLLVPGSSATLDLGRLLLLREREGRQVRAHVSWWEPDGEAHPVDCDTATKATEWVEQQAGPQELWESLLTFRWQTASDFTLGTDADRKRFVEVLLPALRSFDPGLERVKLQLRAHERGALAQAQIDFAQADAEVKRAASELERVRGMEGVTDDPAALRAELLPLEKRHAAVSVRIDTVMRELGPVRIPSTEVAAAAEASREAVSAFRRADTLYRTTVNTGACGTCGATVSAEKLEELAHAARQAEDASLRAGAAHETLYQVWQQNAMQMEAAIRAEVDALTARRQTVEASLRDLHNRLSRAEERQRAGLTVAAAEARVQEAADALKAAIERLEAAQRVLHALELAEKALGPKGARPAMIADAFQALAASAQRVLSTCWPGARVRVDRTSTTQKGAVREESRVLVALPGEVDFHPAGCLNRGMLRRVDLAFRLARRRMYAAQCSGGVLPLPYLCLDEALDGIDEAGLTGCAQVLAEEARTSLVVVLTHDEKVMRGVPYDQRISL